MTDPETQTYATNTDGTISITSDGKAMRYVKESDLLAVKGASDTARKEYESNVAQHNTTLAEANRVKDETHQTLLKERAAHEQSESGLQELPTLRTKVGELETTNATLTEGSGKLTEELTGMKRSVFVTQYKVDPEKVKDMGLDQLREAEKNFSLVGFSPNVKPANYDGKVGAGNGGTAPTTVLEGCANELVLAREMAAKKRSGDADYTP